MVKVGGDVHRTKINHSLQIQNLLYFAANFQSLLAIVLSLEQSRSNHQKVTVHIMKSLVLKLVRNALGQLIIFIDFITRPQRMTRSEHLQGEVDLQSRDLSLYQFHACPFCVKVRRSMIRLNLNIELRDGKNNAQYRQELLEEGGRIKVPCLRIQEGEQVTWLYESKAIITYLDQRFGVQSNLPESAESAESA